MSQHIIPVRTYLLIFAALLTLTATTVWVAFLDLGMFNDVIAVGIASIKACLVILFFMHVKYSNKVIWVFAFTGFMFLAILLTITMSDYLTRGLYVLTQGW